MAEVAESFEDFIRGKTIFVTGATGFVGKVFVEKILRVQPQIKKLYLLIRAPNSDLATNRLHNEVIGKDLFKVLRNKWGADFRSFISEKVVAVAGDVSDENLGIEDKNTRNQMLQELDIIVHSAATTYLNQRYDIAMKTNTMGAFHMVNFAKNCQKIELVLHLSTAYVCGEAKRLVLEEPLDDQMQKGFAKLDINLEKQLIEDKLIELERHKTNKEEITSVMKSFGKARANLHGWPNTYVFTKAMGEMILMKTKDSLPLIIIRPTMIKSTLFEPFPGWIEGVRTIDIVVVHYGNGTLKSFHGIGETILDVIPVDMVVNFMIVVASMALSKGLSKNLVYHIGSSLRNPFTHNDLIDVMYFYFTKYPLVNQCGKPIVLSKKLTLRQNKVVTKTEDFLKSYSLFEGIFDDKNAESLRNLTKRVASIDGRFECDPKNINWKDYMMNIHFPGLMKHSVKKLSIGSKM